MNNQPILFYSTRCSHSKQIIDTLKALNKESLCRMFSIDGQPRDRLPPFLKSVPTLYVPESKDVYIGKDIYSYIAKPVSSRREIPTSTPAQAAAQAPAASKDYEPWSFEGTGSLSDTYSSWNNTSAFNTDNQLNYTFLGASNTPAPREPEPQTKQSYDGGKQGRNDDISSRMEAMKKARESEFKGIARQ
jgi:hypothetical protein